MLEYLRFRWNLLGLIREQQAEEKANRKKIADAKKRNATTEEIEELQQEGAAFYFHLQDEIQGLHSRYLVGTAQRLILPVPSLQDKSMWEQDNNYYTRLTEVGINHMRAVIRAEQKARVELFVMWMPGLVGVLGALIGLVSILVK